MQWIFDNLQLLIAGAALVAYWLNNMRQAKEEAARERQEAESEVEDPFGPDFDFGIPEHETAARPDAPQPPPIPQAAPPPILRPTRAASPPPAVLTAVETEMARQQALQERLRQVRESRQPRSTTTGGAAATQARVTGRTATSSATPASASASLARRLRDRSEIRRAIVLREILGPPPGLH